MRQRIETIFGIFFISGVGGLIYESVWSHYVKLFLGHAAYAQTLVLVVFIGGLALGSWVCARAAHRIANPLRIYALVEAAIGVLALVFHWVFVATTDWGYASLLPATCEQANTFCVSQWLLAALLLAPQSILLGATFPLVSSAVLRISTEYAGHDIATLYFLNSLGAVLGVLASAFVLIPAVGLPGTLMTAGIANIAIAIAAYFVSKTPPPPMAIEPIARSATEAGASERTLLVVLLVTAFLTGLSSFIYEIAWIRMLSLVLGASTHSFELMLASFILGLALGGLWVRQRVDNTPDPVRLLAKVQLVMGVAAAATIPLYISTFDLMAWMLSAVQRNNGGYVFFNVVSTFIALAVMLPATFCAGMTLPLITYRLLRSPTGERSLGLVYAVNTVGAILGVVIAVHFLLAWVGVRGALIVGAAVDVALGLLLLFGWRQGAAGGRFPRWPAVAAVALLVFFAVVFPIDPRRSSSGVFRTGIARVSNANAVVYHRDGKTATVDVLESEGVKGIRTNGKTDATVQMKAGSAPTQDEFTMALLAMLPMGHNPDAKSAAVIGFGSGVSTAMLLASPRLERVDTVEIEPAMVEGAVAFRPLVDAAYADPRSRIVIDDAKSYFARGRNRYDIIVSEPSNPWVSGVASLFTEEFYQRLSTYMNEGAVLSQWLHTYEMDAATLASIFAALSKTFPEFLVYSSIDADLVVIARKGGAPGRFHEDVMRLPGLQPLLAKLKLTDAEVVRRRVMGSGSTLRPFFASYGIGANSDYFPVVEQRASKTRFTQARVSELTDLQSSAMPLLEMLDGSTRVATGRHEVIAVTVADKAANEAWALHDAIMEARPAPGGATVANPRETAARLVRAWATSCRSTGFTFAEVFPAMITVAEVMNPHLPASQASKVWQWIGASACARELPEAERRSIDLLHAVARRDADAMAALGVVVLDATTAAQKGAWSEFAFFASTTALACKGNAKLARVVLEQGTDRWVRSGTRPSEIRYLVSLTDPRSPRLGAGCAEPSPRR